jgi:hypothetical protein
MQITKDPNENEEKTIHKGDALGIDAAALL